MTSPIQIFPTADELREMHPRIAARQARRKAWFAHQNILVKAIALIPTIALTWILLAYAICAWNETRNGEDFVRELLGMTGTQVFLWVGAYFVFFWRIELRLRRWVRRRRAFSDHVRQSNRIRHELTLAQLELERTRLETELARTRNRNTASHRWTTSAGMRSGTQNRLSNHR